MQGESGSTPLLGFQLQCNSGTSLDQHTLLTTPDSVLVFKLNLTLGKSAGQRDKELTHSSRAPQVPGIDSHLQAQAVTVPGIDSHQQAQAVTLPGIDSH